MSVAYCPRFQRANSGERTIANRSRSAGGLAAATHRRRGADHAVVLQRGELVVVHAELAAAPRGCAPRAAARAAGGRSRARWPAAPAGCCAAPRRSRDGRRARRSPAHAAAPTRSGGAAASPWRPERLPATVSRRSRLRCGLRTTRASRSSIRSCCDAAAVLVRQRGVQRPVRPSDARRAAPPTARRSPPRWRPSSRPCRTRRRPRTGRGSAARPPVRGFRCAAAGPVGGVLDHLLGGDVERGVDHGRLDEYTLSGLPPVLERQQQRVERVDARVRIADRVGLVRVAVGISRQPTQSGGILDDVGERRVVLPRAVEPEARHAHHDDVARAAPARSRSPGRAGRSPAA